VRINTYTDGVGAPAIGSIAPRGGVAGTPLVISGSGFGSAQGSVIFAEPPTGSGVGGVPTLWTDTQIQVPIPAGVPTSRVITVRVIMGLPAPIPPGVIPPSGVGRIWIPAPGAGAGIDGLDFQVPDAVGVYAPTPEDINRLIGRIATSLFGAKIEVFTPADGQTVFLLALPPRDPTSMFVVVNGVDYGSDRAMWTLAGRYVTWLNVPFALAATDSVAVIYLT
jgi:hypothetical protein